MSYRLYQVKSKPVASWMLSDPIPFDEHSGSGFAGTASAAPVTSAPIVAYADYSSVLHNGAIGQFSSKVFKNSLESKTFALEAWVYPIVAGKQQILSHNGVYDGLWIEGNVIHFSTNYVKSGIADCSFDTVIRKGSHVIGIHNNLQNQLWVDGVMVASVELTDAQKNDVFVDDGTGTLFSGASTNNNSRLAINAIGIYNSIKPEQITLNYKAGRKVIPQSIVPVQFSGIPLYLDSSNSSIYFQKTWLNKTDFSNGYGINVDILDEIIKPRLDSTSLTLNATWNTAVQLDPVGVTSAYGVFVEWSGNNITVDGRVDGNTWVPLSSGALAGPVTNGMSTVNKSLEIRVNFPAGQVDGTTYLESLNIIGFRDNALNTTESRALALTYPAVARSDFEPITYRDDNGVTLGGGTLTIGPDNSEQPRSIKTFEVWIKPTSTNITISGTTVGSFTSYRNGVTTSSNPPVGEWSLMHYVSNNEITGNITITGDAVVGQAALYPDSLTSAQITNIFKGYTGAPVLSFNDSSAIGIAEMSRPVLIYIKDWAVDTAG